MRVTRRAALLGVGAVSGCSFTPVNFGPPSATPTPSASGDPTITVDPEFFVRSKDGGARILPEGIRSGQRISTPHLDGTLAQFFVGETLSPAAAEQVDQDTPVRAPEGHELAAFTLQAGIPRFTEAVGSEATVHLRVGDRRIPVPNLFNEFSTRAGAYLRAWEMFALCLPRGSDLLLEVTDEGRTVVVDLRTGTPRVDAGWKATTGFRERWEITCDPVDAVFVRAFTTAPPEGLEAETGELAIGLHPDVGDGLLPWTPAQGWAPEGKQWLQVGMNARVDWKSRVVPRCVLDVPKSFVHTDEAGLQVAAADPASISTDAISTGQEELLVVWPVSASGGTSTISFNAVGTLAVDYAEVTDVPAQFTSAARPLEFTATFTPSQR